MHLKIKTPISVSKHTVELSLQVGSIQKAEENMDSETSYHEYWGELRGFLHPLASRAIAEVRTTLGPPAWLQMILLAGAVLLCPCSK